MEVKIIVNDKKTLEFEVEGCDQSLLNHLAEQLSNNKNVEFAAYKLDHPAISSPRMIVKSKKASPLTLVLEELEKLGEDLATFRKEFKNAIK